MSQHIAVYDDALSFFRYLAVSRRDRDWGLFVTGAGHEVLSIGSGATAKISAAESSAGRRQILYRVESPDGRKTSMAWDASYPQPYRYDWNQGRTLVDEFALLYVDSGPAWLFESEATTGTLKVAPGSLVVLFPGVWHRYRPDLATATTCTSTQWCTFGGDAARQWLERGLLEPRRPVLFVGSDPGLAGGFGRLQSRLQARSPAQQRLLAASLWELLGAAEVATQATAPALPEDVIERAKLLLEDVSVADVSAQDVARALQLPYDPFRRAFKLATGLSPHQYRLQMLIRRSQELLEASDMSVKQIAAALHFADQYYFAKAFRRKTGRTPTEWRRQARREG